MEDCFNLQSAQVSFLDLHQQTFSHLLLPDSYKIIEWNMQIRIIYIARAFNLYI